MKEPTDHEKPKLKTKSTMKVMKKSLASTFPILKSARTLNELSKRIKG